MLEEFFALTHLPPSAARASFPSGFSFTEGVGDSCPLGGASSSGQTKPLWLEKLSREEVQTKPGLSRGLERLNDLVTWLLPGKSALKKRPSDRLQVVCLS